MAAFRAACVQTGLRNPKLEYDPKTTEYGADRLGRRGLSPAEQSTPAISAVDKPAIAAERPHQRPRGYLATPEVRPNFGALGYGDIAPIGYA